MPVSISSSVVRLAMAVALLSPLIVEGEEATEGAYAPPHRFRVSSDVRVATRDVAMGAPSICEAGASCSAPYDTWTFVPVDGTVCGRPGTTAGFFINPTTLSRKLLIEISGGGACFHQGDCRASNVEGFDPAAVMRADLVSEPLYDRRNAANVFYDFNYVYFPYCTGDFHMGSNVAPYGIQHMGYANIGKYLERIVPVFADAERVVVAGVSAGGYGATFNYDRIHRAFGRKRVDLISDSGPYLPPPYMPAELQTALDANWSFRANLPAGCRSCTTTWHALYAYLSAAWPSDRMSLLSYLFDESVRSRFALYGPLATLDDYAVAMNGLADSIISPLPNFRVFYSGQRGHGMLGVFELRARGVTLGEFLRQQLDGDPGWTSVRPR